MFFIFFAWVVFFQLIFMLTSADISWKVLKNNTSKNYAKYCFDYERTLQNLKFVPLCLAPQKNWVLQHPRSHFFIKLSYIVKVACYIGLMLQWAAMLLELYIITLSFISLFVLLFLKVFGLWRSAGIKGLCTCHAVLSMLHTFKKCPILISYFSHRMRSKFSWLFYLYINFNLAYPYKGST